MRAASQERPASRSRTHCQTSAWAAAADAHRDACLTTRVAYRAVVSCSAATATIKRAMSAGPCAWWARTRLSPRYEIFYGGVHEQKYVGVL